MTESTPICCLRPGLHSVVLGLLCLSLCSAPGVSHSEGTFTDRLWSRFIDPEDGQFDTSDWLLSKRGFLPVPIIVTEPAVGYGGGAAILFFHPSKHDEERRKSDDPLGLPPSISAVFGAGTENGTWGAGGGHFGSWKEDRIRYMGGGGYASANLTLFLGSVDADFNFAGWMLLQEVQVRILDTDLFLGARYQYSKVDATMELPFPNLSRLEGENAIGGIGLIAHYDSRDNILSPNTGQNVQVEGIFNDKWLGGDERWQMLSYVARSYHQLHPRLNLSLRLDGNATWGDVPFYALPFVDLRGIPAMRYQGDATGEGEFELRVRVYKRFSLVGFFGVGWAVDPVSSDTGPYLAGGGGLRYLLARKLGLQMGIDVARGPEETAFYIQTGSSW